MVAISIAAAAAKELTMKGLQLIIRLAKAIVARLKAS